MALTFSVVQSEVEVTFSMVQSEVKVIFSMVQSEVKVIFQEYHTSVVRACVYVRACLRVCIVCVCVCVQTTVLPQLLSQFTRCSTPVYRYTSLTSRNIALHYNPVPIYIYISPPAVTFLPLKHLQYL
jgi:hypothetical protein